jgi:hypothetical protein
MAAAVSKGKLPCPPASLILERSEAIVAKRSLQAGLELVNRVHAQLLPGPLSDSLDHAARMFVIGITVLRDADRTGNDGAGVRKDERDDPSTPSTPSNRKGARP